MRAGGTGVTNIDDLVGEPIGAVEKKIVRFLNVKKHKAVKLYQDLPMVLFGLLSGQIAALAYPDAMLWKVVKDASVTGKIQMKKNSDQKN
jgi:hypothetical protein